MLPFVIETGAVYTQTTAIRVHSAFAGAVRGVFEAIAMDYLMGVPGNYRPIRSDWPIWSWTWKWTGTSGETAPERVSADKCDLLSRHAHGLAIDLNAPANPRAEGRPNKSWQSQEWCRYTWRDTDRMVRDLESIGWDWGGHFTTEDYMHFGALEDGTTDSGFTTAVCE